MRKIRQFKSLIISQFIGTFLLAVFLLTFSVNVSASGESSFKGLPYDYSWNFDAQSETMINSALAIAQSHGLNVGDNTIVFYLEAGNNSWLWDICVANVSAVNLGEGETYDTVNLATDRVMFSFSNCYCMKVNTGTLEVMDNSFNPDYFPSSVYFFGNTMFPVSYDNLTGFKGLPFYGTVKLNGKVFVGANITVDDEYPDPTYPDPRRPWDYDDPINPATPPIRIDRTPPTPPQLPSPTTPTPIPFPTIDTSTIEGLLQGIIDVVNWGFNTVINKITSFISFIGDLASFIVQCVLAYFEYYVNVFKDEITYIAQCIVYWSTTIYNALVKIIDNIQNFAKSVLDSLKSVSSFFKELINLGFEDGEFVFSTFIRRLIVPDQEDIIEVIEDNDTVGVIRLGAAARDKTQSILDQLTNVSPTYRFYVPSTTYHNQTIGGFYIDFSWYEDYKSFGDLIIGGFITISYAYWVFLTLSSHLRGHSVNDKDLKG